MKLLCLLWFLPVVFGDTTVTCIYSKECVLPCIANHKDINIIHWYKDTKAVHSYFDNQNQLGHQSGEYKGRTSLIHESDINNGNVSLLLKNIMVRDEGRYKCYTADDIINDEKYVTVSVEAHVKSVDIDFKNDTVTCSINEVYPEPDVYWFSSNSEKNGSVTNLSQTENQLISVTSKLRVDDTSQTHNYKCVICSKQDPKKKLYTAILEHQELYENILKCPIPQNINYTLNLSYNTSILTYDSNTSTQEISEEWKERVTFYPQTGTVKLSHLNEDLETYTCDVTTAQGRHILIATVTSNNVHIIIILVVIVVLVIILGIALFVLHKKNLLQPCNAPENKSGNKPQSETKPDEVHSLTSYIHKDEDQK